MSGADQSEEAVEVRKEDLSELFKLLSHPRRVLRNSAKYGETWEDRSRAEKGKKQVEDVRDRLQELRSHDTMTDHDGDGQLAYLTFAHQNAGYVLDGVEDATIRVGLDRDFTPGQRIDLRTPGGTIFAHAIVEKAYESRVGLAHHDTVVVDGRNHPSKSQKDLLTSLRGHYPETEIDYDTEVTIIYFDVVDSRGTGESQQNQQYSA
jgi:hypothetical protein